VTSLLALFVALGGTVYAAATIGASDIKRNAVRSKHIKSNNVKRADIAANAVNAAKIASNAVANSELGDNAVTSAEVAGSAIGSSEISDGSIGPADLGVPAQWTDVQYALSYATYDDDFDFGTVQCWKDPFGIVHLRGAAERTLVPNAQNIALLPEECRVFPPNPAPALFAGFAVAEADSSGFITGSTGAWVEAASNTLGTDQPPPVGAGLVFDGVTIGSGAR
jgi:hypothetical protein